MNDNDGSNWTKEELAALRGLATPVRADKSLEQRVVDRLRAEGEIQPHKLRRRRTAVRTILAFAMLLLAFLGGVWTGQQRSTEATAIDVPGHILLLYEDASFVPAPAGQVAERFETYRGWARDVRERGIEIYGDELVGDAPVLRMVDGVVFAEAEQPPGPQGRITGFFIVETNDTRAAEAIARTIPHLRYGGRVAVVRLAGH